MASNTLKILHQHDTFLYVGEAYGYVSSRFYLFWLKESVMIVRVAGTNYTGETCRAI